MQELDRPAPLAIPESWMRDWLEHGHRQITDYLAKYDAYLAYCVVHERTP